MKTLPISRRAGAIALLGAAALLSGPIFAPAAQAQGPQGGFGGPGGGGPGGGGGFNRRPPFAFGTVSAIDTGAGTITISGRGGGPDQTVQTQGTTRIVTQAVAAVSDLKKGDTIEVQGVPTGITASSVTIGQSPLSGLGGPGGGGGGGFGGPGGGGGFGGPSAAAAPAAANATGTVTSTSPLTISLSSTASLVLKMDPSAKVTKYTTATLSSIKVGDRILGIGTANDDGSFAATTVAVNMDTSVLGRALGGGFGRGRRGGGGPGGGGFGGPGGGGGGFGGPGGPAPGGFGGGPGGPPNQ